MSGRPEHQAPPEIFYDEDESKKYTQNTRIINIQRKLSERALELLCVPEDNNNALILDLGCGSGLSGEVLTEAGHQWVGVDVSPYMLSVAREREVEGGLVLGDMGYGLPFRSGLFDGCMSISALQWLCNADKKWHVPKKRLIRLFETLYMCLKRGARAVFQLYPENPAQMELITSTAMRCGFTGGLIVDYPHSTKAKKYYLCLFAGAAISYALPAALGTDDGDQVRVGERIRFNVVASDVGGRVDPREKRRSSHTVRSRAWVLEKKARQRKQGRKVRPDSKYTGRKRPKF